MAEDEEEEAGWLRIRGRASVVRKAEGQAGWGGRLAEG